MLDENKNKLVPLVEYLTRRHICNKTRVITQEMQRPRVERESIRNARISDVLEHARQFVPYYRNLFRKLRFRPENVKRDIRFLEDLPYLTKELIHLNPDDFISETHNRGNTFIRKTSGSTGRSLDVHYDSNSLDWTAALNRYTQNEIGRTFCKREVLLNCEPSWRKKSIADRIAETLKGYALNRVNVLTKTFDPEALRELYNSLKVSQAYLVQGHPSTMYHLTLFLKNEKIAPLKRPLFNVFESTGETISADKAKFIEENLGCKIFNKYGAAEFGVVAFSKDNVQELKVIDSCFYAENFVYGFGLPEVVVTGALNYTMPLIRYRTGDLGEIVRSGEQTLMMNPHGRLNDILEVNNKLYPTDYLKNQMSRVADIDEFQVIITKEKKTCIRVVASAEGHSAIRKIIHDLLGAEIEVSFVKLNQLVRVGWRDKFKYLIHES